MKVLAVTLATLALAGCQTMQQQAPARVLYPTKVCEDVQVPIYGMLDRPASGGEVLGGAVVGGVIGNQFGKGDGNVAMTILGALVGSNVASERKQEQVVTGYRTERQCRTVYK
jgi:uncharacterized protein YcfJ